MGALVQMVLKSVLDLILLQLLDHFLKEPGFTELAFDPMSNSSRLLQSPPEVELTIPKNQHYSNFRMVPPRTSDTGLQTLD